MAAVGSPNGKTCTECPTPLTGNQRFTCSMDCRQKRHHRQTKKGEKQARGHYDPAVENMAAAAAGKLKDIAMDEARELVRPVIREALNDGVLDSLGALVTLTPKALEVLQRDLESEDEQIHQRAYQLILRYTVGHGSLAPPPQTAANVPLQVVFNVPQSGQPQPDAVVDDAQELRECMECREVKTADEFFAGSIRCNVCHERITNAALTRFKRDA